MGEVLEVHDLDVLALGADGGDLAEAVDDLGGGAGYRVGLEVLDVAADGGGQAVPELGWRREVDDERPAIASREGVRLGDARPGGAGRR